MRLDSNWQLYDYLIAIGVELNVRGAVDLSRAVFAASRMVTGMSTEFLGESRIVLRKVQNEGAVLTDDERLALLDVLRQLDDALDRRP